MLSLFVSACASTDKRVLNSPEVLVSKNALVELKAQGNIECDQLLDECALVVDQQEKAINSQRDVIKAQDDLIASQNEQIDAESAAKNRATGIAIGSSFWLLLLLLL